MMDKTIQYDTELKQAMSLPLSDDLTWRLILDSDGIWWAELTYDAVLDCMHEVSYRACESSGHREISDAMFEAWALWYGGMMRDGSK